MITSKNTNKYLQYNFQQDEPWQRYLKEIGSTTTTKTLEKKKRIWYRNNVDKDFNIFFDADETNKKSHDHYSKNDSSSKLLFNNNSSDLNKNTPSLGFSMSFKENIYTIEGFLKLSYFVLIFVFMFDKVWTYIILFIICVLGIIRQLGSVEYSMTYIKKFIGNEFVLNILYGLIVMGIWKRPSQLLLYPITIHFLIGVSEFVAMRPEYFETYLENKKFKNIIQIPRTYKETIMEARCTIELAFLGYALLFYYIEQFKTLDVLVYLFYLVYKLAFNKNMQLTISKMVGRHVEA